MRSPTCPEAEGRIFDSSIFRTAPAISLDASPKSVPRIFASDAAHCTVGLRALEGAEALHKRLLEMPDVANVRIVGLLVEIDIEGGDEACARVLQDLITRGVKIVEFVHQRAGLEDLFMTITKGKVQ